MPASHRIEGIFEGGKIWQVHCINTFGERNLADLSISQSENYNPLNRMTLQQRKAVTICSATLLPTMYVPLRRTKKQLT